MYFKKVFQTGKTSTIYRHQKIGNKAISACHNFHYSSKSPAEGTSETTFIGIDL